MIAHFLVGMLLFIIFLKVTKKDFKKSSILLFILCLIKEAYDLTTLNPSYIEPFKDTFITFLYPMALLIVRAIKKKASQE